MFWSILGIWVAGACMIVAGWMVLYAHWPDERFPALKWWALFWAGMIATVALIAIMIHLSILIGAPVEVR